MALPLEGVVVADLTQNVAGPFCTQVLGDMGADVIKIERPGRGDDARAWAPPWWGDQSATFLAFNRNKRSLALDLKTAAGRAVLKRLVARVDVFVQSLSAEATRDLGVDFVGASAMNSRLVYCAITAFGTSGPLRDMMSQGNNVDNLKAIFHDTQANSEAVINGEIDRRRRQRDIERHAIVVSGERLQICADLVADVAIRGNAIGAYDGEIDPAMLHQMTAGVVGNHGMRHAMVAELPRRE